MFRRVREGSRTLRKITHHLSLSRPLTFAPTAATAADPGIRRRRCALADVRHPARRREGRGGGWGWGDGAGRAAAGRRIRPALGSLGGRFRPRAIGVASVLRGDRRAVRPRGGAEQRRVSEHDSREDIARKSVVRSGDVMTLPMVARRGGCRAHPSSSPRRSLRGVRFTEARVSPPPRRASRDSRRRARRTR